MRVDKYTLVIIFGSLGFLSLITMWIINKDFAGGPFALLTIIFFIATFVTLFYPVKK